MHYKNCPQCDAANNSGPSDKYAVCGVYYAKWLKSQLRHSKPTSGKRLRASRSSSGNIIGSHIRLHWLVTEQEAKKHELAVRCALLIGMAVWGWFLIQTNFRITTGLFAEIGFYSSFIGSVTLVFHEAGHVLFSPFGRFMAVLGGSLFQLLVPGFLMLAFVYKYKNAFAGSVACWWLGYSFMDLAPYINDAEAQALLLLGGGTGKEIGGHDWHNLLSWTGLMEVHEGIASLFEITGEILMIAAVVWGVHLLCKQYQSLPQVLKMCINNPIKT
ncbi:MAG: hypothetical protein ACI9CE_001862 [Flavobacterium sp.]